MWHHLFYFVLLFLPTVWLVRVMNNYLPNLYMLNTMVGVLCVYFMYVTISIKSEVVVVRKKQTNKKIKQICVDDGRCFDVWGGFANGIWVGNALHLTSRITDKEYDNIKVGKKYLVKSYVMLGYKNRCILSIEAIKGKSKQTKQKKSK